MGLRKLPITGFSTTFINSAPLSNCAVFLVDPNYSIRYTYSWQSAGGDWKVSTYEPTSIKVNNTEITTLKYNNIIYWRKKYARTISAAANSIVKIYPNSGTLCLKFGSHNGTSATGGIEETTTCYTFTIQAAKTLTCVVEHNHSGKVEFIPNTGYLLNSNLETSHTINLTHSSNISSPDTIKYISLTTVGGTGYSKITIDNGTGRVESASPTSGATTTFNVLPSKGYKIACSSKGEYYLNRIGYKNDNGSLQYLRANNSSLITGTSKTVIIPEFIVAFSITHASSGPDDNRTLIGINNRNSVQITVGIAVCEDEQGAEYYYRDAENDEYYYRFDIPANSTTEADITDAINYYFGNSLDTAYLVFRLITLAGGYTRVYTASPGQAGWEESGVSDIYDITSRFY